MLMKSFAVERGPKHFFSNHENEETFEFFRRRAKPAVPFQGKIHMEG